MTQLVIVSITTVIFGIASLLLISRARNRLSEGSIRRYMDNFAICLAFIVIFSVWQTMRSIFGININIEGLGTYPEFIFIIFAYISFVIASFKVLKISEEFGFKEDGRKIDQIIKANITNKKYLPETIEQKSKLKMRKRKYKK